MLILRAAIFLFITHQLQAYRLVCYLTNWAQYRNGVGKFLPQDINPNLCTHLIYSFAKLTETGLDTFEWNDEELYKQTMNLRSTNSKLKILIAVGGWNAGSAIFSKIVNDDSLRAKFVKQSVEFLQKYNFDGLDLDWEYPGVGFGSSPSDKKQFVKLCKELKTAYKPHKLLLTAAMAAGKANIDTAYDVAGLSEHIDFFNLMTYDYHGSWETVTGANAPLYPSKSTNPTFNVDFTVDYYIKNGMPRGKINLGMGTYGRSWTLASASSNEMGSSAPSPGTVGKYTGESGYLAYYEICQYLKDGWTRKWDSVQKVPYIFKGNQWASYDDEESLKHKVDYLKTNKLGGAMFWTLDLDDFTGTQCNDGKYPLINSVKKALTGATQPDNPTTTRTNPTTTTTRRAQTTTTTRSDRTTTRETSCPKPNGFFPVKGTECKRFIRCINGKVYNFNCPAGTYFDARIDSCNKMSNFHCVA